MTRTTEPEAAGLRHHDERIVGSWQSASARRFVLWLLAGAVGTLVLVGALNAVVDPYDKLGTGLFPTVIPEDSSTKLNLLNALHLPPQVVVLGSSRAMGIDPAYIRQKTGLRSFNAAVRSGTPLDAWGFANYIHDRFPGTRPKYLWMLDVNAFQYQAPAFHDNLFHTPALARYFPSADRNHLSLSDIWSFLSWQTTKDSLRAVQAKIDGAPPLVKADRRAPGEFTPDGGRPNASFGTKGRTLHLRILTTAAQNRRDYSGPTFSPEPTRYFEKTLAAMNRWGIHPVLVLTPIHPELHAIIGPQGWDRRHQQVLDYLAKLQHTYRFTVLDMTSITSFGGSANQFVDGSHMKQPNLRLMIDAILRRDPGLD